MQNSDDDFDDGFDLLADEIAFYTNAVNERLRVSGADADQSDDSRPASRESGYCTSRWNRAPVHCTQNPRRNSIVVSEKDLKLKQILTLRHMESRARGDHLLLTFPRIAWHMLEFIAPNTMSKLPGEPVLYSLINGAVSIDSRFTIVRKTATSNQFLINLATPLVETRVKLEDLLDFTEGQRIHQDLPSFIQIWIAFFDKYMMEYFEQHEAIKRTINHPSAVLLSAKPLCSQVALLHRVISPLKQSLGTWKWSEVEFAWSCLFNAIGDPATMNIHQARLSSRLFAEFLPAILSSLDHIYSYGKIPDKVSHHFVMFSPANHPSSIPCTRLQKNDNISLLWTDDLLSDVVRGCHLRSLLGAFHTEESVFTSSFHNYLETVDYAASNGFLSFNQVQRAFCHVAAELTASLSVELFKKISDASVRDVIKDIKNVAIGATGTFIAKLLFCSDASNLYIEQGLLLHKAMESHGVSRVDYWRWAPGEGFVGALTCRPPAPLSCLLRPDLSLAVNNCLNFWLKLFRMNEILLAVLSDPKCPLSKPSVSLWRQFQFIVNKLYLVIGHIRELFHSKVTSLFDACLEKLDGMNTFDEAERAVQLLHSSLASLVDRNHSSRIRDILDTIHIYAELADDIRVKSLGGNVSDEQLNEWYTKTKRTYEWIHLLGKQLPHDNIFHHLFVKMGLSTKGYQQREKESGSRSRSRSRPRQDSDV